MIGQSVRASRASAYHVAYRIPRQHDSLLLAGLFAGGGLTSSARPCLVLGDGPLQIAAACGRPASSQFHRRPRARQRPGGIVDQPEDADFAVADDSDAPELAACAAAPARMIGIAVSGTGTDAIIHLSRDADADFRIFVRSSASPPARRPPWWSPPAHRPAVTASLAGGS